VVQAGLDGKTFVEHGQIVTHSTESGDTFTDKFIDANKNFSTSGIATKRAVEPTKTDAETKYIYSSEEIYKGLERAVKALIASKVKVIVGDCGFDNGIQDMITSIIANISPATSTPCLMSTLTLLPTIMKMVAQKEVVLVLTANGASFEKKFKQLTNDAPKDKVKVLGLEKVDGFGEHVQKGTSVDLDKAKENIMEEIKKKIEELAATNVTVGCILCECTELPAYSNQMRDTFKLPVFDAMTCASLVADSVKRNAFGLVPIANNGRHAK
tara:strand:- start:229 stop:1035 length:807 start_codon:yes stop_codon:yes gene_type:complete